LLALNGNFPGIEDHKYFPGIATKLGAVLQQRGVPFKEKSVREADRFARAISSATTGTRCWSV
jgi:hypothetical protein